MFKKVTLLLLVLALPAGIYLFLRGCGRNGFEVPVYDTIDPQGCGGKDWEFVMHVSGGPDVLPPGEKEHDDYKIVSFLTDESSNTNRASYILSLTRAYDALIDDEDVGFVTIVSPAVSNDLTLKGFIEERDMVLPDHDKWLINNTMGRETYAAFIKCGLGFEAGKDKPTYNMVLIDRKNRIRGYYDGLDNEEVERMILETRILLRNERI